MRSRHLARLESQIAASGAGEDRDALVAERVSYLARLGQIDQARDELRSLRAGLTSARSPRVSVLAHIADGLCHYYANMGVEAKDRFLRAHAVARATGLDALVARSASWLALIQYGAYQFADMAKSLDESLSVSANADAATQARACLVIAQCIHLANRFDLALPWYRRARILAAEIEDEATISALMHNMASIWASNVRNASLGGPPTSDSSRQALAGAVSTLNFDDLVGLSTLGIFTPLLQAQLFSVEEEFDQALVLYTEHLDALNVQAVVGWQAWLLADKGWCQLKAGQRQASEQTLVLVNDLIVKDIHVDDRAAALTRLSQAHSEMGKTALANEHRLQAAESWQTFAALQQSMLAAIESSSGVKWMEQQRP